MTSRHVLTRDGVRLAYGDLGSNGDPVVLLHGLAGHAGEWALTASWLTRRWRIVAPDARGHGRSERVPGHVSRAAHAADAAFVVEQLRLAPAVVVGQSLGGLTAMTLAAERPDLVRGLVVIDATPAGAGDEADLAAREVADSLREWPVPFASRAAAEAFFEERFGGRPAALAFADGLEQRDGAWWPRFDVDVMARTLHAAVVGSSWDAWQRIACRRCSSVRAPAPWSLTSLRRC